MNKSWGEGDKKFLRTLFEEAADKDKNYFNDYLEPLFYEALAKERDDDFYSRFECKIPFLNGGLFDPISNYDWVNTAIDLPNDIFSNTRKTKDGDTGDGVLDIFDRYNFTVKEDEPLEKEVAVDPEMLGKVFENLLEVKDRKSKGTYYTPREIVHYMCEQSLVNYLATELKEVLKGDVEKLIKIGENVVKHEATHVAKKENDPNYEGLYDQILPASIEKFAKEIDEKLATIKVCDPAIGSGAFPVGMMNAIVKARMVLSSYLKDKNRTLYAFKRDCIQNSLYGVDIDPGAVEIAKLRLWLSLVVDEDNIRQIKPLPNLDYKIMQGNSLLEEFEGIKLFDEKILAVSDVSQNQHLESLKSKQTALQKEYFELHYQNKLTPVKKVELTGEVQKIQRQLNKMAEINNLQIDKISLFAEHNQVKQKADELKRLHKEFFEVSQKSKKDNLKKQIEKLEWELIEATLKEQGKTSALKKLEGLKRSNTKPFFLWRLNFADVFEDGGFDIVIANPPYDEISNNQEKEIFKRLYAEVLSGHYDLYIFFFKKAFDLTTHGGIISFITPHTYLHYPQFRNLRKMIYEAGKIIEITGRISGIFESAVVDNAIIFMSKEEERKNYLTKFYSKNITENKLINESAAVLADSQFNSDNFDIKTIESKKVFDKFLSNSELLGEITESSQGITVYAKVQGEKKNFFRDKKTDQDSKPVTRGREIQKYHLEWSGGYIQYGDWLWCPRDKKYFENEKLFFRQTSDSLIGTFVEEPMYCIDSVHSIINKQSEQKYSLKYILTILNSKFGNYLYRLLIPETGKVFAQVKLIFLRLIPIKKVNASKQKPFIDLVEKILKITKTDDYLKDVEKQAKVHDLERQIDELVYKLYGLTKEDIEIVEESKK